ncbi:MAG: ATP-binding protein [Gammaproteobacteria bacterium]|jgi:two-component system osmolarity sensor histidine kinase EnvZ|nr:ATP-binding protein [Gammaproteobacteria bacterium]MDH3810287.1 ATP-binding protein [Gammaproteobacteria bacterium]
MKLKPRSLFGRTAVTIALTLLLFMAISMGTVAYFIYIPLAHRHADDFAAVIVSAAHSLQSLPEEMHEELKQRLLEDHGLIVAQQTAGLSNSSSDLDYNPFFREALAERAGQDLPIVEADEGPLIWVDVPAHGKSFRLGFDRTRLGVNPPLVLLLVVVVGAVLTLAASVLEVRRVTKPLERLSEAANKLARGHNPPPLPEEGPEELAALAHAFNSLSTDLHIMSENRTVMIAGISHDLRTPLTRLAIAVEMLDEDSNPQLVAGIRRDLDAMNVLIGQFLQFTRGVEDECPVQVDLRQVIESLAMDLRRDGAELRLHCNDPPCVYFADPVALERVLANLMKNAAQHGDDKPIDVTLFCSEKAVSIDICDRGPGIPADQVEAVFRPFHRLESARGMKTGGSGLGLAIANQLAIKHGWTITVDPRDGGGTVMRLGLPATSRFGLPAMSCQATESSPEQEPAAPLNTAA